MNRGKVSVHGTLAGFLFVGASYQHCWFKDFERDKKEQIIVESNGSRKSFRCPECGAVVILDQDAESQKTSTYHGIKNKI